MARNLDPVDPSRSPWHLLGAVMRHWRHDVRSMALHEVGKRALVDASHLSKWERGEEQPPVDAVHRIEETLRADGQIVAVHTVVTELGRLRTLAVNGTAEDKKATMERRRLLQLAAASIGSQALGAQGESVRQLLDLALTGESRSVEDWALVCGDHLHAIRTRPAAQVRDDLLWDLLAVERQLTGASVQDAVELRRVVAALSCLHANVLTRLGDHGSALRWWRTARDAADATGDRELSLQVRGSEAGFAVYGQRDPQTVLRLTQNAQQKFGGDGRSVGAAKVVAAEAKALTLLGRHAEARTMVQTLHDFAPADQPNGIIPWYWTVDQVAFAASWVHAGAGDEPAADQARERVLTLVRDYQYSANVRLHEALCTVVNGGTERGMQRATAEIDALPPIYRSQMIMETGRMVLRAVPLDHRERPSVSELRELLTTGTDQNT